jgi:hypothetical protein
VGDDNQSWRERRVERACAGGSECEVVCFCGVDLRLIGSYSQL